MKDQALKLEVLKELMDHLDGMEVGKLRPKAVEISVSSSKPAEMEAEEAMSHEDGPTGEKSHLFAEGQGEPNGDEMSPEEAEALEKLLGGEKDEEEPR